MTRGGGGGGNIDGVLWLQIFVLSIVFHSRSVPVTLVIHAVGAGEVLGNHVGDVEYPVGAGKGKIQ
jgi:hypothetical protein